MQSDETSCFHKECDAAVIQSKEPSSSQYDCAAEVDNYDCDVCSAAFLTSSDLKSHVLSHTDEDPQGCNEHVTSFSQLGELKQACASELDKTCHSSDAESDSRVEKLKIYSRERPHYDCDGLISDLNRHMQTHTEESSYKCTICNATFTQSGSLKRHINSHTGRNSDTSTSQATSDDKRHRCHICGAGFRVIHLRSRRR